MAQKKLHPSVSKFKEFVRNNPKIIQEVRKGNATWQELYEDWYLLGEEDSRWDSIGKEKISENEATPEKKTDLMASITGMMKKMDPNQVQHHINSLSQAIGAIQGLLTQFQGSNQPTNQVKELEGPKHPFSFRKD
ncbi:YlbD family protein [Neobacillus sp. PS3-40]|jgi:hypothetical protein|uniref:YlbD family protein n=1 Tax=Neobacillus sp. PS3-40 TaxID=3070679 RepID=UPI0027E02FD9|nr:YlbD family protein [Neobacillus sp. PS3-40]WML43580.1 YlbD family protein [Neobacillus sp. PS3-40]